MKVIALLLILFIGSALSQETIYCKNNRCPPGYKVHHSGLNRLHAVCLCTKEEDANERCERLKRTCSLQGNYYIEACLAIGQFCPGKDVLDYCDRGFLQLAKRCDQIKQDALKKKNEDLMNKNRQRNGPRFPVCFEPFYCGSGFQQSCYEMVFDRCDVDTVLDQCKTRLITNGIVCSDAKKRKAQQDEQETPYQCRSAISGCMQYNSTSSDINASVCVDVPYFCDSETIAKMCYKGTLGDRFEEECAKATKKSQELMFPLDQQTCNQKLKPCEGGDYEACTEVPTLCGKEFVSALCNAKKITNNRMCSYAGLESSASTAYPGCDVFAANCRGTDDFYCGLASRYCDNETIVSLCNRKLISNAFKCVRAKQSISK